jgi:hypothetical protein
MRFASKLFALAALTSSFALTSLPVHAQEESSVSWPPCAGSYNIVRVSEIKPGQLQKFLDAVAAQQSWYKQKGLVDQIILDRVVDQKTGAYSDVTAITEHVGINNGASRPQDDAYKAFVALYQASSTIKTTYFTCQITK